MQPNGPKRSNGPTIPPPESPLPKFRRHTVSCPSLKNKSQANPPQ